MGVTNDQIDAMAKMPGFDRASLIAARSDLGHVGAFETAFAAALAGNRLPLLNFVREVADRTSQDKTTVQHLLTVVRPPEGPLHIPRPRFAS